MDHITIQLPGEFPPNDLEILRSMWHPVAFESALDQLTSGSLLGEPLVVYRGSDGQPVVALDRCPHRGTQLSLGKCVDGKLECPYHGWQFGVDGRCVTVPSQDPSVPIVSKSSLRTMRSTSYGGIVWACPSGEPLRELPNWPEVHDPTFRLVHPDVQEWSTSAARQVENFLDVGHFAFVHRGSFGNPDETLVPELDVEVTDQGLRQTFEFLAVNPEGSPLDGDGTIARSMVYEAFLPFASRLDIGYPDGRHDVILLASGPATSDRCRVFVTVARNYDHDRPAAELLEWDMAILEEDRPIVEAQHPKELPLDLTQEVHVKADRATVAYRRELVRLGLGRRSET